MQQTRHRSYLHVFGPDTANRTSFFSPFLMLPRKPRKSTDDHKISLETGNAATANLLTIPPPRHLLLIPLVMLFRCRFDLLCPQFPSISRHGRDHGKIDTINHNESIFLFTRTLKYVEAVADIPVLTSPRTSSFPLSRLPSRAGSSSNAPRPLPLNARRLCLRWLVI